MKSWCKYCSNSTNSLLLSHRSLASLGSWWSEEGFQYLLAIVIIKDSFTDFKHKQSSKTCLSSKCYEWKYLQNHCKCTWASFEILATLQSEKYWPVTFRQSSDTATWIEVWAPSFKTTNNVKEKKKLKHWSLHVFIHLQQAVSPTLFELNKFREVDKRL